MSRPRLMLLVVALLAMAAAPLLWRAYAGRNAGMDDAAPLGGDARSRGLPAEARAPEGVRVRVQVLNATRVRGLARRATFVLRDHGFDVVETGTAREQHDSTLVVDAGGNPEWAGRVAKAMGGARVVSRPDSSRYLDVTVFVGSTWRPPAQPFYP